MRVTIPPTWAMTSADAIGSTVPVASSSYGTLAVSTVATATGTRPPRRSGAFAHAPSESASASIETALASRATGAGTGNGGSLLRGGLEPASPAACAGGAAGSGQEERFKHGPNGAAIASVRVFTAVVFENPGGRGRGGGDGAPLPPPPGSRRAPGR